MNDLSPLSLMERPLQRAQEMKFGTELTRRGCRFRLWAPHCDTILLRIEDDAQNKLPMRKLPRGWFELEVEGARAGTLYRFVLPDGTSVPDPASRFQPHDVHGPSEVIDPRAFGWTDKGWRGRRWEETIFYQVHVGTFTPEGTYRAAIDKLDPLVELGVTAIQLLPIADFHGRWNWGYDGVLHFAPDSTYGRPDDLKALVDAAHARELMVFVDVVYNHFGPEGNYMSLYAPITTEKHVTPWGAAVNYDDENSAMVREFVTANARYWLNEFHVDGIRFDAVHAIEDSGPQHLLKDLADKLRASTDGRHIHLVCENSKNQAGWLRRRGDLTPGLYTAQWDDDIHHCLHSIATGESHWYYADFHGRLDLLGRALAQGLAYQGEHMRFEDVDKGEPSGYLPPTAFVSYIQNHDQIGNRPFGDRISEIAPKQTVRSLAAMYLLAPQIPLLFMGDEWAAKQPFLYFTDATEELAEKIREGRLAELKDTPGLAAAGEPPPDPVCEASFLSSKLEWNDRAKPPHADWLSLYKKLIHIRHTEIIPRLEGIRGYAGHYEIVGTQLLKVWWELADGSTLRMMANLGQEPIDDINVWGPGRVLWLEGIADGNSLQLWSVVISLDKPQGDHGDA